MKIFFNLLYKLSHLVEFSRYDNCSKILYILIDGDLFYLQEKISNLFF